MGTAAMAKVETGGRPSLETEIEELESNTKIW
jgi:hypothetical protein